MNFAAQTFATQHHWDWTIAVYLFLGGMGAATLVITNLTDMFRRGGHPSLAIWGSLSSFVMLAVGSLMLFIHLLDHLAVIHVMNPLVLLEKPDAWIAWGTQFIVAMMVLGVAYAVPHIAASPRWQGLPGIGAVVRHPVFQALGAGIARVQRPIGWLGALFAFGTAVYTGLLLQSFPAVALWHNPGVPVLFTVSAFSTALAFLLLVQYLVLKEDDHELRRLFERSDAILIGAELLVVFAFFNYTLSGSEGGYRSAAMLWGSWGWLVGFLGLGLIVPFLLELRGSLREWRTPVPVVASALLVLMGGYLLRHYFLTSGVYAFPW